MSLKRKYLSLNLYSPFRRTLNYFPVHSQNFDKMKTREIELEQCKDEILKLKKQLADTKNEVQFLKINKIILENEHYKTINHIKVFLKNSDFETRQKYQTIQLKNNLIQDNSNNNSNNDKKEQEKIEDNDNNDIKETNEEEIKISKRTALNRRKNKIKIQNLLKFDSLRQHISNLNEELIKKNNIITELQNNKKVKGYKELQKSLIKSCNEINEKLKEEKIDLKTQLNILNNLLKKEKNENRLLKEKISQFNQRFATFKELSINKVKKLDQELNIAKEKERNLIIKKIGDEDKEIIEAHYKKEEYNTMQRKINQYEIDIKKYDDLVKKYKMENLNLKENNKALKKENNFLDIQNKKIKLENENLNKKIKNLENKVKNIEGKYQGNKIFFTGIDKDKNKNNKNIEDDKNEENEYNEYEEENK